MLHVPVRVAVEGPQHGRPGTLDDQVPAGARAHGGAGLVHHLGLNTRKGSGGGARLQRCDSRQWGNQHHARLRLPPGVHHGATSAADVLPVPYPGFRVDGLPHRAQQPQRRQVMPLRVLLAPTHKGAYGGGGGVADGDSILGDDGPEPVPVRPIGRALIHHRRCAVCQGSVDDVAVAGDPADVRRAPVDVVLLQVEDPLGGGIGAHQIPTGGVYDALGFARGAAGVQQIQHVLAVHRLGFAGQRLAFHQVVPPDIAAVDHIFVGMAGTAHDNHLLHAGGTVEGLIRILLELDDVAPPVASIGGDQYLGLRVVEPVAYGFGAEPAEHHAMGSADAGASQHRDGQLGNHGQVDGDAVTLFDPQAL